MHAVPSPQEEKQEKLHEWFEIGAITMLAAYAIGCKMENRIRDKTEGTEVTLTTEEKVEDKTDYEKRGFRYIY
ncbi:hypothetical protein CDV31_004615 [Fusarium ambrosium]|uniref:Uncharacterized protein n=1 Tax=Fusarium ambrosium TaxID=131363 RepID=A0A428UPP6_9HYPO|nr:hypothetical protein CDV31_004615 [Fusarium ambrosium]